MSEDLDVREIERGTQVTFEDGNRTVIGTVGKYFGEGMYEITDEDDSKHEVHMDQLTLVDED